MSREEIFKKLQTNKQVLQKLGVRKLALFGSMARGEGSTTSDLDFLVEFEKKTFDAYMDLKFFLEDLFHRPVDLVIPETLKKRLREAILKENIRVPGL
ncbi:MAG: nucleotidyltransferase family protein [Deltaproteobacteria bacterium]|nr:nucleotidyltransferase family protein [Deltaproteobacteria bacterium]MBI4224364.1 nucleotidyltransferase family protein [Deltaproteobacteria bacterium]